MSHKRIGKYSLVEYDINGMSMNDEIRTDNEDRIEFNSEPSFWYIPIDAILR